MSAGLDRNSGRRHGQGLHPGEPAIPAQKRRVAVRPQAGGEELLGPIRRNQELAAQEHGGTARPQLANREQVLDVPPQQALDHGVERRGAGAVALTAR